MMTPDEFADMIWFECCAAWWRFVPRNHSNAPAAFAANTVAHQGAMIAGQALADLADLGLAPAKVTVEMVRAIVAIHVPPDSRSVRSVDQDAHAWAIINRRIRQLSWNRLPFDPTYGPDTPGKYPL